MDTSKKKIKWKLSMVTMSNGKTKFVYRPINANGQIVCDSKVIDDLVSNIK